MTQITLDNVNDMEVIAAALDNPISENISYAKKAFGRLKPESKTTINSHQKAYLDVASMAYKDAADKLRSMVDNAPDHLRDIMRMLLPFAISLDMKAKGIYEEAERIENATRN